MVDGRLRFMLATALIFVMTALSGLGALADAGVDVGLPELTELTALVQLTETPEPEPLLPPFSERLAAAGSVLALVAAAPDGWVPVVPGVDYSLFQVAGPVRIHVARMARANQALFLETSIGDGRLTGGVERMSNQFARYDQAINYWGSTWGNTSDVVVAINGSFWDHPGIPQRGMVQSGWYAKRFSNNQSGSGFVWKLDRTAFIGECITHTPSKQIITYPDGGTVQFQGINTARGADQIIIYTAHFDDATGTSDDGVEIVVELTDRPMLILPPPSMAVGTVRQIREGAGDSRLYFDQIVLSATGDKADDLLANLEVGDPIGISNSLTNFKSDCSTPVPSLDWTKAYASLGGSYYFLENGSIKSPGVTPHNPLTAIAFNSEYIFFIVVDGRDPGISIGMTIDQLAVFVKNTLGATYGINQDGGGSSTMVIDGAIVNNPSDQFTADPCYSVYLPVVTHRDFEAAAPAEGSQVPGSPCKVYVERPVANGIMMVVQQPKTLSTMFFEGAGVIALEQATVRLGPGSNYASAGSVSAGTPGIVLDHGAELNGVYAKENHWWLVDFGSVKGWVVETRLGGN